MYADGMEMAGSCPSDVNSTDCLSAASDFANTAISYARVNDNDNDAGSGEGSLADRSGLNV
jgi:hypothetical protein